MGGLVPFTWCDFMAGWGGGILGLTVGHPLDTIKVHQQTLPGSKRTLSMYRLILSTYKHDGIKGFFRGLFYPAMISGVTNSVLFGVYANTLRSLESYRCTAERRMCCEQGIVHPMWHYDVFLAGCLAGVPVVLISCPVDLIKIKLQSQKAQVRARGGNVYETVYKGPWHAVRSIYKSHGIVKGLYKGTWCMLWRDVPTFGLYMLAYEHILCMFKSKDDCSPDTSILSQIIAGGIAGILSWIVVMPLDVVKSRIQGDDLVKPQYRGMMHCLADTWKKEGMRALFKGTALVCIRAFPCNAAVFVGYEFIVRQCDPTYYIR